MRATAEEVARAKLLRSLDNVEVRSSDSTIPIKPLSIEPDDRDHSEIIEIDSEPV